VIAQWSRRWFSNGILRSKNRCASGASGVIVGGRRSARAVGGHLRDRGTCAVAGVPASGHAAVVVVGNRGGSGPAVGDAADRRNTGMLDDPAETGHASLGRWPSDGPAPSEAVSYARGQLFAMGEAGRSSLDAARNATHFSARDAGLASPEGLASPREPVGLLHSIAAGGAVAPGHSRRGRPDHPAPDTGGARGARGAPTGAVGSSSPPIPSQSIHAAPTVRRPGDIIDVRALIRNWWSVPAVGFNSILQIPVHRFEVWDDDASSEGVFSVNYTYAST